MAAVGKLDTRSKLIRTACALFNKRGYNATGISEILRTCETSIGSLYYHFPGGKEELGVEAIRYAADLIVARGGKNARIVDILAHYINSGMIEEVPRS